MQCDLIASIDKDTVLPTAPLTLPHYLVSWGTLHRLRSATRFGTDAEKQHVGSELKPRAQPPRTLDARNTVSLRASLAPMSACLALTNRTDMNVLPAPARLAQIGVACHGGLSR